MTGSWIGACCACGKAGTGMSLAEKCSGETRPLLICDECAHPVTAKITMPDGSVEYRTFGTRAALEAWLNERHKYPVVEFEV